MMTLSESSPKNGNKENAFAKSLKQQAYAIVYDKINHTEELILNSQGIIIQAKQEKSGVLGYSSEELLNQHIEIIYSLDDIAIQKPELHLRMAEKNGGFVLEEIKIKKYQQPFCAYLKISALKDKEGCLIGYFVSIKDITYKIIYEDVYQRIKNRYHYIFENQIFENQIIGIFKIDLQEYKLVRANKKALEICGLNSEVEFSFKHFFVCPQEKRKLILSLRENIFLDKYHFQARKADKTSIWLSITCLVKMQENYLEGIVVDVTESETRLKELQKANYELDTFIYHASHDLRSPLLSILGLVNLLKEEQSPELSKKYLTTIENRVNHLDKLVKDLLIISRNDRTKVENEVFDFDSEIRQILRDYYFLEDYRDIEVNIHIQQEAEYYQDSIRLRVILNNLISNAFKYRNPYIENSFIIFSIKIDGQKAVLEIRDNGIGIAKAYLNKIFEMFFRGTESSTGSGLGLYIVKSIVEKLKGTIEVKSETGKGTTFCLVLPNQQHLNPI